MSEWQQIQPFDFGDLSDKDGNPLPPIIDTTNTPGSISPPIVPSVDYLLRDENNEVITDQNYEAISLEGLTYA
jgi:hypothetical protein